MSLTVVSTPIGHLDDITLRAINTLKEADIVICEEQRPASTLLKKLKIEQKPFYLLNEHSKESDLKELLELCRTKKVALVTDCGTPGFCDPGADLVKLCQKEGIQVDVNPGASSLMSLISLSGVKLKEFHFAGFLPAEKEKRHAKIKELTQVKTPMFIMDTPYRLQSLLQELAVELPARDAVLGIDLTGEHHQVLRGKVKDLASKILDKNPFVLLII